MKICIINSLYPPHGRGGTEKVVENLIKGLTSIGHEVFLITITPWQGFKYLLPQKEEARDSRFIIYRFFPLNIFSFINIGKKKTFSRLIWHVLDVFNLHSAWAVKKTLLKEKPDMVMTHNLKGLGYLIPRTIKKLNLKHVHTLHDHQLVTPLGYIVKGRENDKLMQSRIRKIYEKINRKLFSSPDLVISPSDYLLKFYESRGFFRASKRQVLKNPIELPSLPTLKDKGKTKPYFIFLYLGQLEWHKGILFLIQTFKKLLKQWPKGYGPKLQIIGAGEILPRVKEMIRESPEIIIRGKLDFEQVKKVFKQIDMLVVPSIWYENSPMVIYESLSYGVPVLASRIGGIPELIQEGKTGFTFEALDQDDLLRALRWSSDNRAKIKKMWRQTRKSVEPQVADKYAERLMELVK